MEPERRNFLGPGTNEGFVCKACGAQVRPLRAGGFRNHCPACLWSLHVDTVPGDRSALCGGLMRPVALEGSAARGWVIVHRCVECGFTRRNRAATDDPDQPDSYEAILALSLGGETLSPPGD